MDSATQGRLAEAAIVKYLMQNSYEVFLPMFGNASCDMVVMKDGSVSRVECKSTGYMDSKSSYMVTLRQIRSNNSGTTYKKFDASKSEILAVYIVPEDRVVLFDSKDLDGRSGVSIKAVN